MNIGMLDCFAPQMSLPLLTAMGANPGGVVDVFVGRFAEIAAFIQSGPSKGNAAICAKTPPVTIAGVAGSTLVGAAAVQAMRAAKMAEIFIFQ